MMYMATLTQFTKMLKNFDGVMAKAAAHADAKKYDVNILLNTRLAPDMFPLAKQLQVACDQAKFCAAYLTGQTAPKFEDNETTWTQMRERLKKTISYLETIKEKDLANAASAKCSPKWADGKWLKGEEYLMELAIPNFYFHMTVAYSLIRHAGVEIGKSDYVGQLNFKN